TALAGTPPGSTLLWPVPDQVRDPAAVGAGFNDLVTGAVIDRDDRRPDLDGLPLGDQQRDHRALVRDGQLHQRFGGLDLHDDVVDLHLITLGDEPGGDLGLDQTLTGIRKSELLHWSDSPVLQGIQWASDRSTASRIRSRSGR